MNLWTAGRPEIERYIRDYLGPQAVFRDLTRTARVLARFGPHLPALVEDSLRRRDRTVVVTPQTGRGSGVLWFFLGAATAGLVAALAALAA
jgi:ubiquinone biosynthesis protein